MKYQFVSMEKKTELYNSLSDIPYEIKGYTEDLTVYRRQGSIVHRQELDNRPMFKGFLGPMWNGTTEDGEPIFRYETQSVYDMLSE